MHAADVEAFPFSVIVRALPAGDAVDLDSGRRADVPSLAPPRVDPETLLAAVRAAAPGDRPDTAAFGRALAAGDDPLPAAGALLGRGPGLTPRGDDVLVGALAMLAYARGTWDVPDPAPLATNLAGQAPGRTTAVAAELLRCAGEGRFAPVIAAVCRAGEAELPGAVARLAAVGATSGRDTLDGIALVCAAAAGRNGVGIEPTGRRTRPRSF